MPVRTAVLILVAAALLGIVLTLIVGREPGFLLGLFITIGAVGTTLGVRRGAVYVMFPLPAFTLFVAAVITGKVHDSSLTSSTAGLGVGFLQWIADVFLPMVIATIAVLVVGGIRWLLGHQLVTGPGPAVPPGRPARASGAGRPGARPDRPGSGGSPVSNGSPAGRPAPEPRTPRPGAPRPVADGARPESARPESARPESARPDGARPDGARPDGARPDGGVRPESMRPGGMRPEALRPDRLPGDQRGDRDRWGDPRSQADLRDGARGPRPAARPPWDARSPHTGQAMRPVRPQDPRGPWDQP